MGTIGSVNNNSVLTPDIIAKESLRLLKNNLKAARLVYRAYENDFKGKKNGDTITIKKPYRLVSEDGAALTNKQPLVDQSETLQITNQKHVVVGAISATRSLSLHDYKERYLKSAVAQLANDVDQTIVSAMAAGANVYYGTPGSAITLSSFLQAQAIQSLLAVPDDGLRSALINPLDSAEISEAVLGLNSTKQADKAFQQGYMGAVAGYRLYTSQNVTNYTGTGTSTTTSAAVSEGVTVIPVTSAAGFAVGDVITFSGVNWVNPSNRTDIGVQASFVVTSVDTGSNTLTINTPLYSGSSATSTAVDHAYKNVSALPASGATVAVVGSSSYRQNFLFHRDAVALAMIPMVKPPNKNAAVVTDPQTKLSIRVVEDYDITTDELVTRLDVLFGTKVIYPELILRLLSA